MVALFGTNDKLALELFIVVVALVIGAGLGLLARRRYAVAAVALRRASGSSASSPRSAIRSRHPAMAAVGGGDLGRRSGSGSSAGCSIASARERRRLRVAGRAIGRGRSRCPTGRAASFLIRAGAVGVGAVAAGVVGRTLLERQRVAPVGDGPADPAGVGDGRRRSAPDADLSPTVAGLTPIVMPNDRFYRIDTALLTPSVDTATWTLRIHGLVDRETTLTWDELIALPMFEQYVTIACVSNEVGGKLVGNAKWTGVRLRDVLDIAGVQAARDPARRALGRRLDRRDADGLGDGPGARADDRGEDERRAAAADPRLPGPAHRARAVRLRVGDEVARPSSS